MSTSKLEEKFLLYWRMLGKGYPALLREYGFHADRKWRFDFYEPLSKTAFEIEGGSWSGGSHTRGKRFAADCEKYNMAQMMGITVFRLTGDMITTKQVEKFIKIVRAKINEKNQTKTNI